ncbi:unnamed protein product [Leptidea sinapis]|uniref:Uncharacterized protein n=1 Tax=Leptidea sinapis TaxID=189913 RepID=A0A5E4R9A5_9NEOP|nr:unnamed protein product [Leptidea sinapis]
MFFLKSGETLYLPEAALDLFPAIQIQISLPAEMMVIVLNDLVLDHRAFAPLSPRHYFMHHFPSR